MTANCIIIDGDGAHTRALADIARDVGCEVDCAGSLSDARELAASRAVDIVLLSLALPGGEDGFELLQDSDAFSDAEIIVMIEEGEQPDRADRAVRQGASYVFCKPFDEPHLREMLRDIVLECESDIPSPDGGNGAPNVIDQFGFLRGSSRSMRKLYRMLRKVAGTDVSVLVYGESGTGKEVVARTVHTLSPRSEKPFIAVNCAAVAPSLLESELFGHEKGSFSGAEKRHKGFFERAHGGTLLLDEITEMDLELQAKLLRVLETQKIRRVGSEQEIALDVRVISATNRPPEKAVADDALREDLYYRLAQFPVHLPPLRRRGSDVQGLAQYFLNELNAYHETELAFEPAALELLSTLTWPGNVRQLKHAVERAYILSEISIDAAAFSAELSSDNEPVSDAELVQIPVGTSLADSERELIMATLNQLEGDKNATAEALGISVKTLYNRLNQYAEEGEGVAQ